MSAPSRGQVLAAFAAIYLLWGGTFLAIRYAVADVPPLLTIGIRCLGGAALLFAWVWVKGRGGLRQGGFPTAAQWRTALIAGAFLFLGCHGILAWAEQRVSSGEAALFMTAIPLWLVLLEAVRIRRVPPGRSSPGSVSARVGLLTASGGSWSGTVADRIWLIVSALSGRSAQWSRATERGPLRWWSPPRCSSPRVERWCCSPAVAGASWPGGA